MTTAGTKAGSVCAVLRSPEPGAPYTYVTTKALLSQFGFETLRDLPDFEKLDDAGLLGKGRLLAGDIPHGIAAEEAGDQNGRDH